jgi:indolepyruvate ferredoxin oxidoreductase beta subunit
MNRNYLITGVGGQGTVLLARLIGNAAMDAGLEVLGAETIGMAQRGGSVVSHIRMGEGLHSPLIPLGGADVIIAFEPAEAVRVLPFLSETGKLLALSRGIAPVSSSLGINSPRLKPLGTNSQGTAARTGSGPYNPGEMVGYLESVLGDRAIVLDGEDLIARCGSPRVINVALLGAAIAKGMFPFGAADILSVIRKNLAPRFLEINEQALRTGQEIML